MKEHYDGSRIASITDLKKRDRNTIRLLIICGLTSMLVFICWFIKPEHIGNGILFWLLTTALSFKLVKMLHEWYHYWSPSIPAPPALKTKFTVDILTTACPGEPREMIIRTITAMAAIRYPHTNYLCDEGNDPILRAKCRELGVIHVTRTEKINAKAGNINNALKQATGDICIVLDPDHVPVPEFIDRVLPYFEDAEIGFVQCVQGYSNQSQSIIARGAAEQTYHFYGPMMMCMNSYGTVQAIGANCTFRRKALDSIGGHAAGLSEDMHTAMQLHAKGWKSVYIPEMLTRGLVPATLSSYYQQQLKWSRGTFELLFRTYPSLYRNFTWRQKLHYFTLPLYFLFGLVNLIDIAIPLLSLFFAQVPWEVDLSNFAVLFIPLCGISLLIRLFAQRWLLEEQERGLHFAGGILRTATWWIFLIGFIYSIFNIKVPYIPTPKEDTHENYLKLSIPNLIVALLCGGVIWYGLSIDWTPFSLAMAFYGCINALMLGYIVLMSQQHFLDTLQKKLNAISLFSKLQKTASLFSVRARGAAFSLLRSGPVVLMVAVSLIFLSYNTISTDNTPAGAPKEKSLGGFYLGYSGVAAKFSGPEKALQRKLNVIAVTDSFGKNQQDIPARFRGSSSGYIPMVCWVMPVKNGKHDWKGICEGSYNRALETYARQFRAFAAPIFINPDLSEGDAGAADPEQLKKGWQYLYTFFNNLGISNLTWVWTPEHAGWKDYYPGGQFVDWMGVRVLNYSPRQGEKDWYSFREIYNPFRNALGYLQKPVMITEFGSLAGAGQKEWIHKAFGDMEAFHEIRGAVLYDQSKHFKIRSAGNSTSLYTSMFAFSAASFTELAADLQNKPFSENPLTVQEKAVLPAAYHSPFVKGGPGKYRLIVQGREWYMRGVAYNNAHDWRDGNTPLTRRQLEKDFRKIKEMGANTIRRYDHSIYDRNVIQIAGEFNLKVLYGFWFDPKIDYYRDTLKVRSYMEEAEAKVRQFKDCPAVLAWSLGNETWGLLKHNYSKPYLSKVRASYIRMVEQLAERIHAIDPERPVLTCIEHEEYQLPGELAAFHDAAPAVDVIGINSYYREQVSLLNHVFYQFDSLRPYLISEFGPRGYWDPHHNRTASGSLVEDNDREKAAWYTEQWNKYVDAYKGFNVGGFAYCWHDRMEGSYTWFGLTDYRGRVKPSYYALKSLWTHATKALLPAFRIEAPARLVPGKEYEFKAVTESAYGKPLNYEWFLLKDEYLEKVNNVNPSEDGRSVHVTIPAEPSKYRLYLFASDAENNVSTASVPVPVN